MIREAQVKDIKDILEIYNDAILNTTAIYSYKPHTIEQRTEWFNEKKKEGYPVFVYEEDGKAVGFATYGQFRPWPAFKYSIEHSIYVHKAYRNKGIAKALMQKLIKAAEEEGYAIIVAGIDSANKGSLLMHEKLGFKHVGTIEKAGYKFDRWLDLVFYQLNLSGPKNPTEE
ncbi:N-acetyltransferase family protein [Clostridium sp. 19966]|uniref:GNAT family N-acetyltransferase n=1 Tax=Clostridium sp. 19966 TaxID=2768166 RepID=UPI0028DFEBC8|nr:GNAT family N-acetyltransferase [Clostridium sp. 19966]MDT8715696.1 N-acetyltransferase family protein [Clostridium sp. 19966]